MAEPDPLMGARVLLLVLLLALPALAQFEVLRGQVDGRPVRAWLAAPPQVGPAFLETEGSPLTVTADMPAMPRMTPLVSRVKDGKAELVFPMPGLWRLDLRFEGERHLVTRFAVKAATSSSAGELCGPAGPDGVLKVEVGTLKVGENRLRLVLPPGPPEVPVSVTMPAMPMAIPPRIAQRQADGSYLVYVPLTMPGVWHLRAEVEGRVLGPVALVLSEPVRPSPSRFLLGWALVALVLGRRRFLPPVLVVVAALVAGLFLERYHPSLDAMPMDMGRADLGMGGLTAPLPVREATATRRRLDFGTDYPASGGVFGLPVADRETVRPGLTVLVEGRPGRVTAVSALVVHGKLDVWFQPPGTTVRVPEEILGMGLCVPRGAVREGGVFVIESVAGVRLARWRKVSLGRSDATYTQVLGGLREGEVVVASPEEGLLDGTLVRGE